MIFKRFERFWHWSQAALVILMLITGFEIHGSYSLLGWEQAVDVHSFAAWTLIGQRLIQRSRTTMNGWLTRLVILFSGGLIVKLVDKVRNRQKTDADVLQFADAAFIKTRKGVTRYDYSIIALAGFIDGGAWAVGKVTAGKD